MKKVPDTRKLIKVLLNYKAETALDKKLLKGLLIRREKPSMKR